MTRTAEFLLTIVIIVGFHHSVKAVPLCQGNCNLAAVSVGSFGAGDGSLLISGSDTLTTGGPAYIGSAGSNTGLAIVTGNNARLNVGGVSDSQFFIGSAGGGNGTLNVSDGAVVTTSAFNAGAGFGDARMYIGRAGNGTVNVTSGGILYVQDLQKFGAEDGIQLGASLNEPGAPVGQGSMFIQGPGSKVHVQGNGAFINVGVANTSFAGQQPVVGRLSVTSGATVSIDGSNTSFAFLTVGRGGGASGSVLVSGLSSRIDLTGANPGIYATNDFSGAQGNTGNGTLHVTDHAIIATHKQSPGVGLALAVGYGLGQGSVLVDNNGLIDLDGVVRVSSNSAANNTQSGRLTINDSGRVKATSTVVGNGTSGAINGVFNGVLTGTGTLQSFLLVQKGGVVLPGNSPGTLSVIGNALFDGGMLQIEVGGLGAGQFDVLDIQGVADLARGTVEFVFVDGFLPRQGDSFAFLSATSVTGLAATTYRFSGVGEGFQFDVQAVGGDLRFVALNDAVAVVPEPMPLLMFAVGLAGIFVRRRALKLSTSHRRLRPRT